MIGTDNVMHDGRTDEEREDDQADTHRGFSLFNALESLGMMELEPRAAIEDVPDFQRFRVSAHVDRATEWLKQFAAIWEVQHGSNS